MELIIYYEGSDSTKYWVDRLLPDHRKSFKKLPTANKGSDFTLLPRYVADILYLDKPDIIISGSTDGIHEKPIFSIEFAGCTPQFQHALQRFPRMLASVENGCPSIVIMPQNKRENSGGVRNYNRSQAIEYGAVRLMDVFGVPAFVFDWPVVDGVMQHEEGDTLPPLSSPEMAELSEYINDAILAFRNVDYMASLLRMPRTRKLVEHARSKAYRAGSPSVDRPGGGDGKATGARLDLMLTSDLLAKAVSDRPRTAKMVDVVPDFIRSREKSLVMYPTRVVKHAGDPYVGMLCYYDIAFCRMGASRRERQYNLVAYCNGVKKAEIEDSMENYLTKVCPFSEKISEKNMLNYSYHLRNGCSHTKSKPVRIYAELADIIVFDDGILIGG